MKRIFTLFAMLILFVAANTASAIELKGQSNTVLGTYQVKELAPVDFKGKQLRAFEITYEKSEHPVVIFLDERANCRDYIVRSKNLEVRYVCSKSSFGAKLVNGKHMKYDPSINAYFLNADEFSRQAKITHGGLSESEALGLVASYFPQLAKDVKFLM